MPNDTNPSDRELLETPPADYIVIQSDEGLKQFIGELVDGGATRCSVDTEADSLHSYAEQLCLIQFNCDGRNAIIDPLAINEFDPLLDFLDASEVWMHGADFDMSMLRKTFDRVPTTVFDTQTAARLTGHLRFGLARMVEEFFGVVLSKQGQKADWGRRPIPEKMLKYAIHDVLFLLPMCDELRRELEEVGRWDWFVESCAAARTAVLGRTEKSEDEVWRIPGWGRLKGQGLAYLRALWLWRDDEARRRNRPPFKILSNDQLLKYSDDLDAGREVGAPGRHRQDVVGRFFAAIKAARALPRKEWPGRPKKLRFEKDPHLDERFDALRKVRDAAAEKLEIENVLIAPKALMERLAAEPSGAGDILLSWQHELLRPALDSFKG